MYDSYNWKELIGKLMQMMRLDTTPIAMKFYEDKEELLKINKIRMTDKVFAPCAFMGQVSSLNWTVGAVFDNFTSRYCAGIHGFCEKDDSWYSGEIFMGAWHDNEFAAKSHQGSLNNIPGQKYEGIGFSPLISGRISNPDVCVFYLTPSQAFMMLSALVYDKHKKLNFTFAGESTCSDSWIATMLTGEPKVSIPCFAERKFAGRKDTDLCLTLKPHHITTILLGLEALGKNGLRYPIPSFSVMNDMGEGLPDHYSKS